MAGPLEQFEIVPLVRIGEFAGDDISVTKSAAFMKFCRRASRSPSPRSHSHRDLLLPRPISHSVRLFAVMLAGHVMLKVFAGFVISLAAAGGLSVVLALPALVMTVLITILEFMMALIQAYVLTMLTCMYLNDALHPSH